jgi:hypothetical protein
MARRAASVLRGDFFNPPNRPSARAASEGLMVSHARIVYEALHIAQVKTLLIAAYLLPIIPA